MDLSPSERPDGGSTMDLSPSERPDGGSTTDLLPSERPDGGSTTDLSPSERPDGGSTRQHHGSVSFRLGADRLGRMAGAKVSLSPTHEQPRKDRRFAATHAGFDVHCAGRIAAQDDEARERLLRYCERPPFAVLAAASWSVARRGPEDAEYVPRDWGRRPPLPARAEQRY